MPGVIEALAAETRERQVAEAAAAAREKAATEAIEVERRRETDAAARGLAMHAAQSLTGRVIFPARWEFVPVEQHYRRCLRESIEGRVTIWVYVNSGYVESIIVSATADKNAECVTWKNPRRQDRAPKDWPTGPGRDWFRRALVELGVI